MAFGSRHGGVGVYKKRFFRERRLCTRKGT